MGMRRTCFRPRTAAVIVTAVIATATIALVGCSSSTHTAASGRTGTPAGPAVANAPSSASTSAAAPAVASATANSIAGRWAGTFTSAKYRATSGDFVVTFTQSGSHIGGTIAITPSCVPTAIVSGTLSGSVATFGQVSGGGTVVTFSGSITPASMHGSYHSDARCGNDTGTWQAHRS